MVNFATLALIAFCLDLVASLQQTLIPVCPGKSLIERTHNYPYVLHGRNPRCYVASRQGPCSEGSVLFAKPRSQFGVCSCECFLSDSIYFDDRAVRNYRYCVNSTMGHTYVYDKKRCACYRLGTQGPCPPGHVLQKDIYDYTFTPRCVKEDVSNESHTPIEQETCPPGTIYSTLLNICTDMNFHGLNGTESTSSNSSVDNTSKCPPGTIYSTLLNICTDMNFHGLASTEKPAESGTCPPGTIYSTLLNICTDMNFHGLSSTEKPAESGTCPPGTIYSTLLNICTDMNFHGLPTTTDQTVESATCPPGTIYSTLLNICTDMNFHGLSTTPSNSGGDEQRGNCPRGTIFSELLNRCVGMDFRGWTNNKL